MDLDERGDEEKMGRVNGGKTLIGVCEKKNLFSIKGNRSKNGSNHSTWLSLRIFVICCYFTMANK